MYSDFGPPRPIQGSMDAALIPWRPLGEMLVERGLLDHDVLEELLEVQRESGRRLGEIIVERGLISGPTLAATLAEQCGVELTMESGFGTGLRGEIQRRHEGERERLPQQAEPSTNGTAPPLPAPPPAAPPPPPPPHPP